MIELWPLRSLSELMYKTVRITCKDGRVIEGKAVSFCDMFELEEEQEMIGLERSQYIDGVFYDEIASVLEIAPRDLPEGMEGFFN